ncbi:MAG: XRE family transcriptional regulator [Spirochaetaceae bacterium]|nr:MAG: XRE family transcriptional regulator [Spirochaetaceae bacterium]
MSHRISYNTMSDDDVIRDLAAHVEKIRIARRIKESELESLAGISRKTLYNFRKGATGLSLRNFIRLLRALGEADRLACLFPESESYSPRGRELELPKRVRDRQEPDDGFRWGDET